MKTNSLPFVVCLYIGLNPLSRLTLKDIENRFDIDRIKAWQALEGVVGNGMLSKEIENHVAIYSIGPTLKALL